MDIVKLAFWVSASAFTIALLAFLLVLWVNKGSQSLVLAFGALFGSAVFLAVQAVFELQPKTEFAHISTSITVGISKPSVSVTREPTQFPKFPNVMVETMASQWLAKDSATNDTWKTKRQKVSQDFMIAAVVGLFTHQHRDWQMRTLHYGGKFTGTITEPRPLSKPGQSTLLRGADLLERLKHAHNIFANPEATIATDIQLPPGSVFEVTPESVTVRNPICEIHFQVTDRGGLPIKQKNDGTTTVDHESPDYENRMCGLTITATFSRWRAQHSDITKYKEWYNNLVLAAERMFTVEQSEMMR